MRGSGGADVNGSGLTVDERRVFGGRTRLEEGGVGSC